MNSMMKIDDLSPYANNSRTHSQGQIEQIARSIDEFGFAGAVVIRDGVIAKGHGTTAAIKLLRSQGKQIYPAPGRHAEPCPTPYPDGEIPTTDATGWSKAQFKAFVIADNKSALDAGWDDEMLRVEFAELDEAGFDLELTGFTLDEIGSMGFDDDAELDEMPSLATGDKEPYQQKTFTLHDEQAATVDDAVTLARTNPLADTGINENSNGNALALICGQWMDAQHG